jgi:hypothetical protein
LEPARVRSTQPYCAMYVLQRPKLGDESMAKD